MKGQSTHRMTRIPNLRSRMIAKNAGIADLAHVAGVSKNTIEFARQDRPIHLGLAACIVIALETRTYTKQKPGPKGPWAWRYQ